MAIQKNAVCHCSEGAVFAGAAVHCSACAEQWHTSARQVRRS